MADEVYWKCPVCGFEAHNEEEKKRHLEETKDDPEHQKAHGQMEEEK